MKYIQRVSDLDSLLINFHRFLMLFRDNFTLGKIDLEICLNHYFVLNLFLLNL